MDQHQSAPRSNPVALAPILVKIRRMYRNQFDLAWPLCQL